MINIKGKTFSAKWIGKFERLQRSRRFQRIWNPRFAGEWMWRIFRLVLLIGLSYIILLPFLSKISSSFMSQSDLYDHMVKFIPRHPTLTNIKFVYDYTAYPTAFFNTFFLSLICASLNVFVASVVGYGLARFQFRGRMLIFAMVIVSMVIPPQTIQISSFMKFKYFDVLGIFQATLGHPLNLVNAPWPVIFLSATGFSIKNGLYILILRQFFIKVPPELNEAAEVDGAGAARTFFQIIWPTARPMASTVFLLAFSWQWLDIYYAGTFFPNYPVLANMVAKVANSMTDTFGMLYDYSAKQSMLINTTLLMIIIPLLLLYLIAQKQFVQGIEHSGIVG